MRKTSEPDDCVTTALPGFPGTSEEKKKKLIQRNKTRYNVCRRKLFELILFNIVNADDSQPSLLHLGKNSASDNVFKNVLGFLFLQVLWIGYIHYGTSWEFH